jgi:ankyrin repeat protein
VPAVELLLSKGTPVHAANRWGTTALMQASRVFNITIVKALLDAGADPDARDVLGKRAIMYAQEKGKPPIYLIRLLKGERETGVKVNARPSVARPPVSRPWWRFWDK